MDITQHASHGLTDSVVRNHQVQLDKRAINALLRKIDLRLMPLLILLFFFTFLDRINIGNRKFGFNLYIFEMHFRFSQRTCTLLWTYR